MSITQYIDSQPNWTHEAVIDSMESVQYSQGDVALGYREYNHEQVHTSPH